MQTHSWSFQQPCKVFTMTSAIHLLIKKNAAKAYQGPENVEEDC